MERTNTVIIGMGSNSNPKSHLEFARSNLQTVFPDIVFSRQQQTEPVGFKTNLLPFLNQLALVRTQTDIPEIRKTLKGLEKKAGRKPEDKEHEIVRLDLDILQINDQILKPEELNRSYYQQAMSELQHLL